MMCSTVFVIFWLQRGHLEYFHPELRSTIRLGGRGVWHAAHPGNLSYGFGRICVSLQRREDRFRQYIMNLRHIGIDFLPSSLVAVKQMKLRGRIVT
jgi:hypothetical protein